MRLNLLNDPDGALQCHASAIQFDASIQTSRGDLEVLLNVTNCRAEAAVLLEPLLRVDPPNNTLFLVLAARAESTHDVAARFAYYAEAVRLAVELLGQPEWGLRLSSVAFRDSLELNLESADMWLQACAKLQASVMASERVACFEEILGQRAPDRPQLRQLAVMTSDALLELGDPRKAEAILRRALEYDPSSPELLVRLDEIFGQPS